MSRVRLDLDREVAVPRILRELHGTRPKIREILATWTAAILAMAVVVVGEQSAVWSPDLWRTIVVAIVAGDVAGGIVANFSRSTNAYYAVRPRMRLIFLALHVVQPLAMWIASGGPLGPWIMVAAITLGGALFVEVAPEEGQELTAALIVAVGTIAVAMVTAFAAHIPVTLAWFAPLYMVKLVLAFAVSRR